MAKKCRKRCLIAKTRKISVFKCLWKCMHCGAFNKTNHTPRQLYINQGKIAFHQASNRANKPVASIQNTSLGRYASACFLHNRKATWSKATTFLLSMNNNRHRYEQIVYHMNTSDRKAHTGLLTTHCCSVGVVSTYPQCTQLMSGKTHTYTSKQTYGAGKLPAIHSKEVLWLMTTHLSSSSSIFVLMPPNLRCSAQTWYVSATCAEDNTTRTASKDPYCNVFHDYRLQRTQMAAWHRIKLPRAYNVYSESPVRFIIPRRWWWHDDDTMIWHIPHHMTYTKHHCQSLHNVICHIIMREKRGNGMHVYWGN